MAGLMAPLKKGILIIDGDRTAGTRERGIGGSWFFGIFRGDPLDWHRDSRPLSSNLKLAPSLVSSLGRFMSIGEFPGIYIETPKLFTGSEDFSLFGGAESFDEGRGDKCKRSPRRTFTTQEQGAGDRYVYPAPPQDPKDFLWLMTEEPHRTRRMAIMKAHPEVSVEQVSDKVFFLIVIHL